MYKAFPGGTDYGLQQKSRLWAKRSIGWNCEFRALDLSLVSATGLFSDHFLVGPSLLSKRGMTYAWVSDNRGKHTANHLLLTSQHNPDILSWEQLKTSLCQKSFKFCHWQIYILHLQWLIMVDAEIFLKFLELCLPACKGIGYSGEGHKIRNGIGYTAKWKRWIIKKN